MSDTLDCSNALQPCNCTANQICVQIGRSSTECARNTCVDNATSGSSGGGGGSNIGVLAGQAVGGVVGGLLVLVAGYWFWRRRKNNARNAQRHRSKSGGHLKELKAGRGGDREKAGHNNDLTAQTPGDEDAQPVKRSSVRIDKNGTVVSRRSLSAGQNTLLPPPRLGDDPFGDHHSLSGSEGPVSVRPSTNGASIGHGRDESQATISEFSFRSSHSTNIIPIAYIPAHSSSHSISDLTNSNRAYGQQRQSVPGLSAVGGGGRDSRSSRLSVPLSLRSSTTNGDVNNRNSFGGLGLLDRRTSNQSGLEIIANSHNVTSPPLTTPTFTKEGKPIRPPRAPGLDLKLPTPEAASPPTSPGFPWNAPQSPGASAGLSPNSMLAPPNSAAGRSSPGSVGRSLQNGPQSSETLMSQDPNNRASAYSTFSQATNSTGSHMSYILDPPQIVTPVSAGRVEVQVLGRGVAKAVKLPNSTATSTLTSPAANAMLAHLPPSPNLPAQYVSSPLSRNDSTASTRSVNQKSSPLSDNPFDDEAAVRIAIPSSAENTPVIPPSPTFGTSADNTPAGDESQFARAQQERQSLASTRRDSDLSLFTSASSAHDRKSVRHGDESTTNTARNSLSAFGIGQGRSTLHPSSSPTVSTADEVILEPPNRPFVSGGTVDRNSGMPIDSRHNSAAMSTRSGYASVLDGIPFNLAMSADQRHSQASSAGGPVRNSSASQNPGRNMRDSSASYRSSASGLGSDKRDTSYSLASEWNGAFSGMPIHMGEDVPAVPDQYKIAEQSSGGAKAGQERDDRYSSDSLAMAAAVARQFGDGS